MVADVFHKQIFTKWIDFGVAYILSGIATALVFGVNVMYTRRIYDNIHCSKELKEHLTFFPYIAMLITPKFNPNFKATDNNLNVRFFRIT